MIGLLPPGPASTLLNRSESDVRWRPVKPVLRVVAGSLRSRGQLRSRAAPSVAGQHLLGSLAVRPALRTAPAVPPLATLADRLGHAATRTLLLMCGLADGCRLGCRAWRAALPDGDQDCCLDERIQGYRLRWLEQRLHPRAPWVMSVSGRRAIGLAALTCGVLILLPVPSETLPLPFRLSCWRPVG